MHALLLFLFLVVLWKEGGIRVASVARCASSVCVVCQLQIALLYSLLLPPHFWGEVLVLALFQCRRICTHTHTCRGTSYKTMPFSSSLSLLYVCEEGGIRVILLSIRSISVCVCLGWRGGSHKHKKYGHSDREPNISIRYTHTERYNKDKRDLTLLLSLCVASKERVRFWYVHRAVFLCVCVPEMEEAHEEIDYATCTCMHK
jgi:hypothetical protein